MDYSAARDAFFQPREGARAVGHDSSERALRDAVEPIAGVCFWSEPAYDAVAALGLDFLQGYVWGRASVLGDADGSVAAAAFGVFEPGLVAGAHAAGRAVAPLDRIRAARVTGSVTALRTALDGVVDDEVAEAVRCLRTGLAVADPTGRALYAGAASLLWPSDPFGALWHATVLLREYRGDGHLAACVAAGLSGIEANIVTELQIGWEPGSYTATRGWSPEAISAATAALTERGIVADGALTAAGSALRDDIEAATDRTVGPVVAAIDGELTELTTTLDGWAQRIVEIGWFPPDPYKRAAG